MDDALSTWGKIAARMQQLGATAVPISDITGGTVQKAVCGVVVGALASSAALDTILRLQDASGTVLCCLHGDVIDEHPFVVTPGAGVILRNVTVINSRDGPTIIACRHNIVTLFDVSVVQPTGGVAETAPAGIGFHEQHHHQAPQEVMAAPAPGPPPHHQIEDVHISHHQFAPEHAHHGQESYGVASASTPAAAVGALDGPTHHHDDRPQPAVAASAMPSSLALDAAPPPAGHQQSQLQVAASSGGPPPLSTNGTTAFAGHGFPTSINPAAPPVAMPFGATALPPTTPFGVGSSAVGAKAGGDGSAPAAPLPARPRANFRTPMIGAAQFDDDDDDDLTI